jgi:hypothetical protein
MSLTSLFGWDYVASAGFNPGEGASRGHRTGVPQRGAPLYTVAASQGHISRNPVFRDLSR